ncbi:30S ribosomal protein S4 [Sediminispirochaeta bajacaliforniensis]|uniref:30S ribosomal protein S4 n=1 Tax=Sediminispirochaeta bajacaliforniensis TaxID=148 RepID=UPI0003756C1C|nr:30S ribosomal protein S4 [Sediminispirochaeta bajacaliforniensis]
MPQKKPPRGKIVRRLGVNLFGNPKYDKILKKKTNGPGKSPKNRRGRKISDYGMQLLEKQKVRYCYGLSEKQFRTTFFEAKRKQGVTDEIFIQLLESRLDNSIYRLGWAVSREQARQMVSHKHFKVNGQSTNIPSTRLKPGDQIAVRDKKNIQSIIRERIVSSGTARTPWLSVDNDKLLATYDAHPSLEAATPVGDLQAIIEFYSK